MSSRAPLVIALSALWLSACSDEDPCERYVDYMCECHKTDPEVDCAQLRNEHENADSELQDECQVALDDQKDADSAEGRTCDETTEDTGA